MTRNIEEIKDRIAGCLWGQAIGDALGLGAEFMSREEVEKNYPDSLTEYYQFGEEFGYWTDDTDMMLCIAESIIKYKDIVPDAVARNFKEWYIAHNNNECLWCFDCHFGIDMHNE